MMVLTVIALLLVTPSVAAEESPMEFAGGDGSENNPYLLSTTAHLDNARKYPDACFRMISDIAFAEEDFAPGGAFYNEGIGWEPIGGYRGIFPDNPFTGVFDGGGYTITGLRITYDVYPNDENYFLGLIGYASGATIKNLHMAESSITLAPNSPTINSTRVHRIGSIVGGADSDTVITNCSNAGTVSSPGNSASYTGGVAGEAKSIYDCWNTGTITGCYAGGVVGAVPSYGEITNCWNAGTVTGKDHAGGIAGEGLVGTAVMDCYNIGSVVSEGKAGGIIGWFPGNSDTSLSCCYNTGSISGTKLAGGIVGEFTYGYYRDSECSITDCFNTGRVTSSSYAGGIAGTMGKSLWHTWNNLKYFTIENSYNIGDVIGGMSGGIVGRLSEGNMIGCYYNNTEITGVGDYSAFGPMCEDTAIRCTNEELCTESTFEDFDFEYIWTYDQLSGYPYPMLQSVEMRPYSVSVEKTTEGVQIRLLLAEQSALQDIVLILGQFDKQGKMTGVILFDDEQLQLMLTDAGASVSIDDYSYCKLILLNKSYIPLLSVTKIT